MFLVRWIADLLGILMNGIFILLDRFGAPNVGLAIILFTIIMYALMMPLQIQQQRFAKLNAVMQPEIKKVQDKYKNKRDQASMQRQNEELQAVYSKYGVSATGSCVQLLIQMPILFALYQVIYKIPGYIMLIKNALASSISADGFTAFFTQFVQNIDAANLNRIMGDGSTDQLIDTLYSLNSTQWTDLLSQSASKGFAGTLQNTYEYIHEVTYFLGLNISDSPSTIIVNAWHSKSWLLILGAILIPVLAYVTQVLNVKLMPQASNNSKKKNAQPDQMEATMRSMNVMMPFMSSFFCLTLPVGIGIYWIAGSVVRSIQQLFINRRLEKEGVDKLIEKNREKAEKKAAKNGGKKPSRISQIASQNMKNLSLEQENEAAKRAGSGNYQSGSLASKADLVRQYNEKNRR